MGASITLPEQTMSMRTILDRYRRGMPLEMRAKEPLFYNGEFPDISKLDISEIHELKRQNQIEIERMELQLQKNEEYKKLKKQKDLEEQLQKLKQELEQQKKETKNDS